MPRKQKGWTLSEIYNDLRADFRAGTDSRFVARLKGVDPMGSGADYHYRSEQKWLHMLERARHYQRDDQIVGQAVRRLVANIVQDGFQLDMNSGDDKLDADLKAGWQEWCTTPDLCHNEGELSFSQMESLALSTVVVDGDVFCLPLREEGSLQWVEAHRCRTPRNTSRNVVHGVMLNDQARRQEYWFTKEDLSLTRAVQRVSDIRRVSARDQQGRRQVHHLYMPYRFSQRRGITFLAPVSDTIGQHDDVQFATLVRSQIANVIAIFHKRGPNYQPLSDQQKGDRTTEVTPGGTTRSIEGVGAGLEVFGDIDEELQMDAARIPSPEFFTHAHMLLTFIAVNLDMPVHVLLLDPSKTNFSGWRGAIDQARLRFKQIQAWLISKFHMPIFKWWVEQQAARPGANALREAIEKARHEFQTAVNPFRHRWNPPAFPYIEPLTDVSTDDMQVSRCLNSRRRVHAARGRDSQEVDTEIVSDNGSLIEKAIVEAIRINGKFPEAKVNWREVVSIPLPSKASATLPLGTDQVPQNSGKGQFEEDGAGDKTDDAKDSRRLLQGAQA